MAKKRKWPEDLLNVIWSFRTTASRATSFSPFRLLFGEEAVTPKEIQWGSLRTESEKKADKAAVKDSLEETRLEAVSTLKRYHEETKAWRNNVLMKFLHHPNLAPSKYRPNSLYDAFTKTNALGPEHILALARAF